jgi:hypothetical protein
MIDRQRFISDNRKIDFGKGEKGQTKKLGGLNSQIKR